MKKPMNRWVLAIIGVIVLVFAGMVYAWTVLSAPIAAQYPEWTKAQLSLTFTLVMFCFCIGGVVGGILSKKFKPWVILISSAVLFILGFFIASRATSLIVLYIGFGVLAGFGSGFAYNAVMTFVGKWFPDKQGLISGILLMGFGIGAFIIGKVYTALTPSDGTGAWRTSFLFLGIITAVIVAVSMFFISAPPLDWQAPAPKKASKKKPVQSYEEINTITMFKRSSFWLFFLWAICLSAAGLMVVSQGTPMAMESMQITAESATAAQMGSIATIVGFISIFNGVGRIIFGFLFDKIGRFLTMLLGGIVFIVAMLLVIWALKGHSTVVLVFAYIASGIGYGCVTPTNSAFASLFYGMKNYPVNLPVINMNLLIASFGSTIAGAVYDSSGSYVTVIILVIGLLVVGTILGFFIRKPKHPQGLEPQVAEEEISGEEIVEEETDELPEVEIETAAQE